MADNEIDTLMAKLAATRRQRPPVQLLSGTRRFELRRRLGGGGFGDVYEARDREHGTLVALKSLRTAEPDWIYRFKREFRVVGDLAHPNIARLYELFCEDDRWYLTMELIEGLPFDQYVARSPDQTRSAFTQLALGLAELHRAGCLHRDIKPSNALVESTGRVVLLDFGLTLPTVGALQTVIAGTPPYMAPELATRAEPSTASDWYSFGIMLYEALAGERPFHGDSAEIYEAKRFGRPPVPSELVPGADPVLESLAMRLLSAEPAARPGVAEILEALQAPSGVRGAPVRTEDSVVVGRGHELEVLDRALAVAADERAAVAAVYGHPGMGKSSLLREFAAAARRRGAWVFEGRCHETEALPYKGIDGVIDALCNRLSHGDRRAVADLVPPGAGALVQMFPVFKRVGAFARAAPRQAPMRSAHWTRRTAARALRELWTRMAASAPVVVILDDLQWASDDTVALLLELLAVPAPPVLTVVSYRLDAVGAAPVLDRFLAELAAMPGLQRFDVPIDALDEAAVEDLLAARDGLALSVAAALRETGGHPFLLSRLLDGEGWTAEGAPPELSQLLAAQLDALEPQTRRLLEVVSVAGAPIGRGVAFGAADLPVDPTVVDELRRQKLIHCLTPSADAPIEAYHDRVREIAVAGLEPGTRRELHQRLAETLEARGALEPETLALHYHQARDTERALRWARRAARHAAGALAFNRATEIYERALELDLSAEQRLPLLEELAASQVQAGRRTDAGDTFIAAADLARTLGDPDRHAALRARAGEHLLYAGHLDRGLGLIRDALVDSGIEFPDDGTVAVARAFNVGAELATRGLAFEPRDPSRVSPRLLQRLDLELAVAQALPLIDLRSPLMAGLALRDALEAGDPRRVQRALVYYVISNSAQPDHPLLVEAERRAQAMAMEQQDELDLAWAGFAEAIVSLQRDDFARVLQALDQAARGFAANGTAYAREAALARMVRVVVCGANGVDIPEARRICDECIDEARSRDDVYSVTWARSVKPWLELADDDPDSARRSLAAAAAAWPSISDSLFASMAIVNDLMVELYADPATAWEVVERLEPRFWSMFSSMMDLPRSVWAQLASAAALGAYAAGRAGRDQTEARIQVLADKVSSLTYGLSARHLIAGHLRLLAGDRAGAAAAYEHAAGYFADTLQAARALAVRHRVAALRGDPEQVRRLEARLRDQTVLNPARYVVLFCGPIPP